MSRVTFPVALLLVGIATSGCGAMDTQDGESYASTSQAIAGQQTYLYFNCNATGWDANARTRLVQATSPGVWTITYDVAQAWMTTGWDTCTLVETNKLDGWGTQQHFYDKSGSQQLTVPALAPGNGQYILARPGLDYHFNVKYPALGKYRLTVNWKDKTFSIARADVTHPKGWLWPVAGQDGKEWVINNYVDLDNSPAIEDYRGGAKSYDGHLGTDIDITSFREMDLGMPVVAASAGMVTGFDDSNFDRNTHCDGMWNDVAVLTDDGYQTTYGHLKKDSVVVNVGDRVEAGATLAMVGSSGCSTWPHLHFEVFRNDSGDLVDPFLVGLWASPPTYNPPLTIMAAFVADHEILSTDQIADPSPSVTAISRGGWIAVGLNAAGGGFGDHLVINVTAANGAVYQTADIAMPEAARHTMWYYNWIIDSSAPTGNWTVQILVNGKVEKTYPVRVN